MSDEEKIKVLKTKVAKKHVPSDEKLNFWLFQLKCYKQHLSTIIPPTFLLMVLTIIYLLEYLGLKNKVEEIAKLFETYSNSVIFSSKVFPIIWALFVYYRELQETDERIFKIELIKNFKSLKD
jgi:hypothetical protein